MPSHPRTSTHSPLEINPTALFQRAQVRSTQCLGGDADFEVIFAEFGDGQAGPVDAYAVAEVRIGEDRGAGGDGEGGARAAAGGVIVLDELGDGWVGVSAAASAGCLMRTYCRWSRRCR